MKDELRNPDETILRRIGSGKLHETAEIADVIEKHKISVTFYDVEGFIPDHVKIGSYVSRLGIARVHTDSASLSGGLAGLVDELRQVAARDG